MSIVGAPPSIIGPIDAALSGTSAAIAKLIAKAENYLANAPGVAGMVVGEADPDVFFGFLTVAGQEVNLIAMGAYIARMQANLAVGAV